MWPRRECAGFRKQDVMVAGRRIRAPDAAQTLTQRRPITAARTASGDAGAL